MSESEDKVATEKRERTEDEAKEESEERPAKKVKETADAKDTKAEVKLVNGDNSPVEPNPGAAPAETNKDEQTATETSQEANEESKPTEGGNQLSASEVAAAVAALPPALPPVASTTVAVPPGLPPGLDAASSPDMLVEEKSSVSAMYVGRVIGKGGEMIRDLQARSSCRIDVDQNVPQGQPRVITYKGTRAQVDFAKSLVSILCRENGSDADLPLGDAKQEFLMVPGQSVGKIIGRSGEMIRELQSRSHAKIQVDHNRQVGADQKHVTIIGTELAVKKAKEMVLFLVANPLMDAMQSINMLVEDKAQHGNVWGSGPPYPNLPNMGQNMQSEASSMGGGGYGGYGGYSQQSHYGGGGYAAVPSPYMAPQAAYQQQAPQRGYGQQAGAYGGAGGMESELFLASKQFMGRIIGQKGVTINDLQRRSSTDLQINQDVPPGRDCEITIRGSRQGIDMVKGMLKEIIEVGPNHPYAGGGAGGGSSNGYGQGGYGQGGYGQQGQYGYQAQSAYAQPYGGVPAYGQQVHQSYSQAQQAPAQAYMPTQSMYQQSLYAAPQAVPMAAPVVSEWQSAKSPDGQIYYYNQRTGQTQWDKPLGMP